MNLHLIFEDKDKKILGEVDDLDEGIVKARFLGEIVNGRLIGGTIRKPSLDATIRVVEQSEIPMIVGEDKDGYMKLGVSPFYNDFPVFLDVNNFFSNHFAVLGNSGSGKSCTVASIIQNLFKKTKTPPLRSNIVFFDAFGEYTNAFSEVNSVDNGINYKVYTTNPDDGQNEMLHIPVWLLDVDDLALLLDADTPTQLPIIEKTLKLVPILTGNNAEVIKRKL